MGFFIRIRDFCYYNRKVIIGLFLLFLFIIIYIFYENSVVKSNEVVIDEKLEIEENVTIEEDFIEEFVVDIKGAVVNPGTYVVTIDNRVIDVINMAGGLLENCDTNDINLSKKVFDEMVIYVPFLGEKVEDIGLENKEVSYNDGKISINSASVSELMNISGIGEVKAKNIIEYRNKFGLFKSIEEIKNVSGIGNSTFEKIKAYIKL